MRWVSVGLAFSLVIACVAAPSGLPGGRADPPLSPTQDPRDFPPERPAVRQETPTPRQPPAEVRSRSPLTRAELAAAAAESTQAGTKPVRDRGVLLAVYRDINGDGLEDLCFLTVETKDPDPPQFRDLADYGRLFQKEAPAVAAYVEVFAQTPDGSVTRAAVVPLGKMKVLHSFGSVEIAAGRPLPFAVGVSVALSRGTEHRWVLFGNGGGPSLFVFQENQRRSWVRRDIDGDGVDDLLFFQTVFEDGTGFETFIHWYGWNGATFRQIRSVNILRNLRAYLKRTRDLAVAGDWRRFLNARLNDADREAAAALAVEKALGRVFRPAAFGRSGSSGRPAAESAPFPRCRVIDLAFPLVTESPFVVKSNIVQGATLPIRVTCRDGETYFFSLRVNLADNPFGATQFHLDFH